MIFSNFQAVLRYTDLPQPYFLHNVIRWRRAPYTLYFRNISRRRRQNMRPRGNYVQVENWKVRDKSIFIAPINIEPGNTN